VGQRLGANVVELLATALREVAGDGPQQVMPRAAHLLRAQRYIAGHLADPDLSPPDVAQALRISVRYLYLLFQAEGTAPAHWILERRLEQASRLLADPLQAGRTITDIAFSVGFKDASHFTRAFKSRHGLGPASTDAIIGRKARPADWPARGQRTAGAGTGEAGVGSGGSMARCGSRRSSQQGSHQLALPNRCIATCTRRRAGPTSRWCPGRAGS
jgi:AraC-like DNA-binding protein